MRQQLEKGSKKKHKKKNTIKRRTSDDNNDGRNNGNQRNPQRRKIKECQNTNQPDQPDNSMEKPEEDLLGSTQHRLGQV